MKKQEIVVVGGGFGGIKSALELSKYSYFKVTLVADKPFFEYYPMMYHTASGGSKVVSTIPLGELFAGKRIEIIIDKAIKINRGKKTLKLASGQIIDYDAIIFALGTTTNYFGIKGMDKYSFGIKSLKDAEILKTHLHKNLMDPIHREDRYVVIGGGPTGIEIAGALQHHITAGAERGFGALLEAAIHGVLQRVHVEIVAHQHALEADALADDFIDDEGRACGRAICVPGFEDDVGGHRRLGVSEFREGEDVVGEIDFLGGDFRQREVAIGGRAAVAGHMFDAASDAAIVQAFERGARQ